MTTKDFSFIIPVYNRPEEIIELLDSFCNLECEKDFEVIIVEDGSQIMSEDVVSDYLEKLHISYFYKPNSGPGDSRNFGMQNAKGNYFIILDSDCILPKSYLNAVLESLNTEYVDCFGGPDAAHDSFSKLQKAINFSMTSFITTGGIRGGKKQIDEFQPRSFNMGLSREAFKATQGFGKIHPGEDPDLSLRLKKLGFSTKLIPDAFVYHKRRVSWSKFYKQVYKFGLARPILNMWHPESKKITYWFPTLFTLGLICSIVLSLFNIIVFLSLYILYFVLVFILSCIQNRSIEIALYSIAAICIQFLGYGIGFLKATLKLGFSNKPAEELLPNMFFK
ncbi:MAG: glycosyltransferase [Flavobacteriaceae bacterium]|nr:glycosyltransferase [Flavobacteriaceae bacterium]